MVDFSISKQFADQATSEPIATRLSRNISSRRRELGLTQAQLAERLGVDTETLSRFERGKHLPSLVTLERLAGLLLTTVAELLAEDKQKADDETLILTAWLSALSAKDRAFVKEVLKNICNHLASRHTDLM